MLINDDDDLFEGLESDEAPFDDFDVSRILRTLKKLDYKLQKQEEYKKLVEEKLKTGIQKTKDSREFLRNNIFEYMRSRKKKKLTFDDVGTVSLGEDKEEYVITDEDALLKRLLEDLPDLVKTTHEINKKAFKEFLTNENNIKLYEIEELKKENVPGSLRVTLK